MTFRIPGQTSFALRRYIVRLKGFPGFYVEAADAAGAKYEAFKRARDVGYFTDFHAFLSNGVTARADRRAIRFHDINPELGL